MLTGNLDLLNVTSLKFRDDLLSSPFRGVQFGVVGFCWSIFASLISLLLLYAGLIPSSPWFDTTGLILSLLLSDGKSGQLVVLSSNIAVGLESWRLGKVIDILQALVCHVELLVDMTTFPHLEYAYNLDSIASIVNSR